MDANHFLAQLRSRLTRVLVLEGAARVLLMTLSLIVVLEAADYCWPTPGWFRLAALLALLAAVAIVSRTRLLRPLRCAMDDRTLAQFVERRLPALDGRLLTVIDGIPLGQESQALQAVLVPEAVTTLVPARRLPRWLAGAGAAVLALGCAVVLWPGFCADACSRLFLPLGGTQWARGTMLQVRLDHEVVASDRKLQLEIERHHWRSGRDQADYEAPVVVSWEPLDGGAAGRHDGRQLPGMRGTQWQAALPALPPGRWRITVESGDAEPAVLEARSVSRPSLVGIAAVLTPPAYAHLPAQHLTTLACSALPGSALEMHLRFAAETGSSITDAMGETHAGSQAAPLELTRSGDDFIGHLSLKPGAPLTVTLSARDQDGIVLDPPASFTITPIEDHPPSVALSGPATAEAVSTHALVAVAIDASDDYALAKLELRAQDQPGHAAGAEAPQPKGPPAAIASFPDAAGAGATTRHATVTVSSLAALGDQLQLTGWASDANDVTGPGTTTSAPILLRVVTDEALRQELDHLLGDARERVSQAREEIGAGLAKPAKLAPSARAAKLQGARAQDLLAGVLRRWAENQLPAEQIQPATAAAGILRADALPTLAQVSSDGSEAEARQADAALAKAEKLLGSLLQEGDLTRHLADLIAKQDHLTEESRAFVLAHLTRELDEAAHSQQASIAERQLGVAQEMKDLERQILANNAAQLEAARTQVHDHPIGPRLADASDQLGSADRRTDGVKTQSDALADMRKLLEALRGGDAAGELADRIGELAAKEEGLVKQLDAGKRPADLAQQQKELTDEMKRLQPEAQAKDADAGKAVAAAGMSGDSADQGMQKGDREGATRDAATAAQLLRAAQQKLSPDNNPDDKKKQDDKKNPDVVALLKELLGLESQLVADASITNQALGEKPLDFASSRTVSGYGQRQSDILLRLREEGLKALSQNPIATIAVNRVAAAMQKAQDHLQTPALGATGMRYLKIALAELGRLIDICDQTPPPHQGDNRSSGNGGRASAAFPPQAELSLLAAMQQELSRLTDADRPVDVAKSQADLRDLVDSLEQHTRPGSRPNLLLARSRRAMASAAAELASKDRGLLTRDEQMDAEAEIRRMIAESGENGDGKGGSSGPKGRNQRQNQSQPEPAPPTPGGATTGAAPGSGTKTGTKSTATSTVVEAPQQEGGLRLDLPEEARERLKEAKQENLAPRALQIYERYLELLDDQQK